MKTLQFSRFALLVCSMVVGGFGSLLAKTGTEPGRRVPANSEAGPERAATSSADGVAHYRIDVGQSRFMVHAFAGGLEIPLRQTSFGIKPVSIGGGTIKVKDEVKLSFDIVAH